MDLSRPALPKLLQPLREWPARATACGVALVAVAGMAGCGLESGDEKSTDAGGPPPVKRSWGTFEVNARIADKIENGERLNFVLSIVGTGIPIYGPAEKAGFERGAKAASQSYDHPIDAAVIGPVQADTATQVSQIRSRLNANQVDCLVFGAGEPDPFVDVINQAIDKGVPVFGVTGDSPESHRLAFYALNEEEAGRLAGKLTGEQIDEQGLDVTKAALLSGLPEGPWAQERMRGFVEGLQEAASGIEFVNDPKSAPNTTFEQPTAYSRTRAFITGHDDVQLIFHTDQGVEVVGKAIADLGLTGEVFTSGFNVSPAILDHVDSGEILVSIGQGFNKQAEAGAKACGDYLLDNKIPANPLQYLDPIPVTKENAAEIKRSVTTGGA